MKCHKGDCIYTWIIPIFFHLQSWKFYWIYIIGTFFFLLGKITQIWIQWHFYFIVSTLEKNFYRILRTFNQNNVQYYLALSFWNKIWNKNVINRKRTVFFNVPWYQLVFIQVESEFGIEEKKEKEKKIFHLD